MESVQDELQQRNQLGRDGAYLIEKVTATILSNFLRATYGEAGLIKRDRLMHSSSRMAIATAEMINQTWLGKYVTNETDEKMTASVGGETITLEPGERVRV